MRHMAIAEPTGGAEPLAGSLWTSNSTGRRGVVLWVSKSIVCISFDEHDLNARKEHSLECFLTLYNKV